MNEESKKILVSMADLKVTKAPNTLTTIGLGSCVGICLFDIQNNIIGLAHAMLPDSKLIVNNSNKSKFVDTSISLLIDEMLLFGANRKNIKAKVAGGAQMFKTDTLYDNMRIGEKNSIAAKAILKELNIPLVSLDVGGNHGRTITFEPYKGELEIKTIGLGIKKI